jgi:fibronectin type 3 domain-containing protein
MKPDTIPPVASVFRKYKIQPEGMYLEWVNSTSEDLEHQVLLRSDGVHFDTILKFNDQFYSYIDSTCAPGKRYTYQIIAFDEVNNNRSSESMSLVFEPGYRPAPSNLAGKVDRANKKINLTWENNALEPIYAIRIYRAKNDGPFKLIETLHENVQEFEDSRISPNNTYRYKVKITYKSGKSSKMSESISLIF